MNLHIDTENPDIISLFITDTDGNYREQSSGTLTNKPLITHIATFLSSNGINQADIDQIRVTPGPGSHFTRTRIGVTIANALAFGLKCPVNGKEFEIPIYHKPPNITKPKTQ